MIRVARWLRLLAPLLLACGSDSTGPTIASVAGTYTATTFTATRSTGTTDLLAGGATVIAMLNPNGTRTGSLHVPAALNNGTPVDQDLTGTWGLTGGQVIFHQTAATFLPDLAFTVRSNQLEGFGAFGGATLHIVLTK